MPNEFRHTVKGLSTKWCKWHNSTAIDVCINKTFLLTPIFKSNSSDALGSIDLGERLGKFNKNR